MRTGSQYQPCTFLLFLVEALAFSSFVIVVPSEVHAQQNDQPAWHIRLGVFMPAKGLQDTDNALGISPDSTVGEDLFDIPDQPHLPWTDTYLDLAFPHPEWGGDLTDFSSDFRSGSAGKAKAETWRFEVRANVLNEEVSFSWHGPAQILANCRLRDAESGRLLVADPAREGYTFIITSPSHAFIWEYLPSDVPLPQASE